MKVKSLFRLLPIALFAAMMLTIACKEKLPPGPVDPGGGVSGVDTVKRNFTFGSEVAQLSPSGTRTSRMLGLVGTTSKLSKYGGWLTKKVEAKGFFYTLKTADKGWIVVDPEGYYFYTVGVNSVSKTSNWTLPDSIWAIGANTMGSWSDETIQTSGGKKMPYTPRWNVMLSFKNTSTARKNLYDTYGIIPVFDPKFPAFADSLLKTTASYKNDPYVFGHFIDNELPIYDNATYGNVLDRFLAIADKTDANFLAARDWMIARKGANYVIAQADRDEFPGYVVGTYYKIASEALKKYDPNHMNLGSRFHGAAKSSKSIFREAGKYADIVSVNVYDVWTLSTADMDMWTTESGKPFFITEYYAKAVDSGLTNATGAGWLVKTQADRRRFFENFTLALIEHKGCVGFHHFRFQDDADTNSGLVNGSNKWWPEMKASYYKVARDIYFLREAMVK